MLLSIDELQKLKYVIPDKTKKSYYIYQDKGKASRAELEYAISAHEEYTEAFGKPFIGNIDEIKERFEEIRGQTELLFLGGKCLVTKELYEGALVDRVNYDKSAVINYLVNGKSLAHCGRECRDVFTDDFIALSFAVQTDGEYYWRSDLPYYISQYNLRLPDEFLKKINY